MPVVCFIIILLSFTDMLGEETKKRYRVFAYIIAVLLFMPSFYAGTAGIIKSYILSAARERYIYKQKNDGNMNIQVKSPIPVDDTHSPLYGGIDILPERKFSPGNENDEYVHNIAKSVYYGIDSLAGIQADGSCDWPFMRKIIRKYLDREKKEQVKIGDLLDMIYENW
jgi:hypothetical protein